MPKAELDIDSYASKASHVCNYQSQNFLQMQLFVYFSNQLFASISAGIVVVFSIIGVNWTEIRPKWAKIGLKMVILLIKLFFC